MTPMNALSGTVIWYLTAVGALVLLGAALASLICSVREHTGKGAALLSGCCLLLIFLVFVILMDCGRSFAASSNPAQYTPFERMLFALPWLIYCTAELASALLLLLLVRAYRRFWHENLTADAIREAINLLPEGIAVIDTDGTVRLSNLHMNALCSELTGAVLSDAARFLGQLAERREQQGSELLLHTDSGEDWLFAEDRITVEGREYRQLIAKDVTERYRIIGDLKKVNAHLMDIQRHMKAVSNLSADMFTAEEQARARAALHNQLGQVLLMGQYYLNHPERSDPEMVYFVTRQMNRFLLGEAAEPDAAQRDSLTEATALAGSIGVTVVLEGAEPQETKLRTLLGKH